VTSPRVAGIVLAAGMSRRMGERNKLLESVDGQPMVARAVEAVLGAGLSPVVVVVGHEAEKLLALLKDRPVLFVHNPDYAKGQSTSLRRGIQALPHDADGVVICLGDMPRVSADHVRKLVAAFDPANGKSICVPMADGRRGNPILWGRQFFDEMRAVEGDRGARDVIRRHEDAIGAVPMDDAVLMDVDSPDALAAARKDGA
jgi:molybdenum cofactor cytidylyltransferase